MARGITGLEQFIVKFMLNAYEIMRTIREEKEMRSDSFLI